MEKGPRLKGLPEDFVRIPVMATDPKSAKGPTKHQESDPIKGLF